MFTTAIITFMLVNFANVVISTTRSLCTIKCGKWLASVMNAFCYGFYTYVIVLTATEDFSVHTKAIIVFLVNLVGVFCVKFIEEKIRKDRLWIYQVTAKETSDKMEKLIDCFKSIDIKVVSNEVIKDRLYSVQIFSYSQKESAMIEKMLDNYNVKFATIETTQVVNKKNVKNGE